MEKSSTLNLRAFALATLVPVIMMMTAMWFKPLWRDEYFSLFYSDPQQNLSYLSRERWNIDAHPSFCRGYDQGARFYCNHAGPALGDGRAGR